MQNKYFEITLDKCTGGISSIVHPLDEHHMNWCAEDAVWGLIRSKNRYFNWDHGRKILEDSPVLESFTEDSDRAISVYSNGMLKITVERFFRDNGNFVERYTAENMRQSDVFVGQDNFGIAVPFNDRYMSADECMVRHCNAHIWCGHNSSYINAMRMGESDLNLGLVLTDGAADSYSIEHCDTNVRGIIILNSGFFTLTAGEKYVMEWELFWHTGNADFYKKSLSYSQMIQVNAVNYTVFQGEPIEFYVDCGMEIDNARITCNGCDVEFERIDNKLNVCYQPNLTGEYKFEISIGSVSTYAEFIVVKCLDQIIEKRLNFIVDKQQYLNDRSPLYGAFLIYDNKEKHLVFDEAFGDHNACRERIGMALLLAKYLQTHSNPRFEKALELYIAFVKREFYEETTGNVYNDIGKNESAVRLYNAPWMMMLFAEMYLLKKDTYYTDQIVKIVRRYYEKGGGRFYPNGISFTKLMQVLTDSGNPDAEEMFEMFKMHAENMINIGTSYPPHEVSYEQTIVTPAVTLISDMGILTGEHRYVEEARKHLVNLERFNGHQPSYHLNELPIRYWDGFWFGKSQMFGDTFPHYWSCLTSRSFLSYYQISGEKEYLTAARKCMRNCLCLFDDEGKGACAYIYPYAVDGSRGQFYDEWANDQDFALYIALTEGIL